MPELLFLLLPLAALSGWWIGRRQTSVSSASVASFNRDYYRGLNFLLNEQPDKAIEVFLQLVAVDDETVELHLALGQLFRRRGEVDRAIRIHQHLAERPLPLRQQRQAQFELARDYFSAGLFDRAELICLPLLEQHDTFRKSAHQLLDIYQQEREWQKAITVAVRLQQQSSEPWAVTIAHFYCELAEERLAATQCEAAATALAAAQQHDPEGVRPRLLQQRLALLQGDSATALLALRAVIDQRPDLLPESIAPLLDQPLLASDSELRDYLQKMATLGGGDALCCVVEVQQRSAGDAAARHFLSQQLQQQPTLRGVAKLLELHGDSGLTPQQTLEVGRYCRQLAALRAGYRCRQCGFTAQRMHWHCPSCRQWDTLRPLPGG